MAEPFAKHKAEDFLVSRSEAPERGIDASDDVGEIAARRSPSGMLHQAAFEANSSESRTTVVSNDPPRDAVEPEAISWWRWQIRQATPSDNKDLRDDVVDFGAVDPPTDVVRDQGRVSTVELIEVLH